MHPMYRSRIMNGFAKLWVAMFLSLMLASAPSMAAHMDGYPEVALDSLQLGAEQVGHDASHADHVGQDQTESDCQDVCCSGTCISATLTDESAKYLDVPRMTHDGTSAVEYVPARVTGLLRPPKI